jgi:hypothetical protein
MRAPPSGGATLGAVLSTTHSAGERPLTLPVAPREGHPVARITVSRSQDRFCRPFVSEGDFLDPERLPSTSAPEKIAFATVPFWGNPPPISRLCHRRFGFRRFFTPPALSRRRARPILVIQRLFASGREGPRAACRLPAIDTIREHNLGSPEPRMTSPTVARRRSHSRDRDLSIATLSCGWRRSFRSAASRDVTGQGPRRGQLASARRLPPRSLAGRASPQPNRLGHLMSLPVTSAGWSCLRRGELFRGLTHERA